MKRDTEAVKARIQLDPAVASKTHVARAPKNAQGELSQRPLVIIYPASGQDESDRLSGPRVKRRPRHTLHIVGDSWDQVATLTDRLKGRFVEDGRGVPLVIEGEVTSDIVWDEPVPIDVDTDVTPPVIYQVVELAFTVEPA